ncbi:MAG: hypothetical protein CO119_04110 [Flavobacteriales bacterium CG_4_9_14_3_um_filter_40_17]|nr:MAG: hypothetical protein CO119_04110 [Flavobacteriales bacterium CG_4_9_14_3_um_filter_40_17]
MSQLLQLLNSVDDKFVSFVSRYQQNLRDKEELQVQLRQTQQKLVDQQHQIVELKAAIETLKIASTISGSDKFKHETKIKINALVRQIDQCIEQLTK